MAMNRQRRTSNISNIFSYDDAGNIVIKDYSQVIRYSWNGTIHGFIGPVSVSSVSAAVTDTDKFLVSDGGVLKFRTGAEVLSDIGGQPLLTNPVTGTGVAGQVAYWNGTNSQTGDNNLVWNAASIRLGIGRTAAARRLEIQQGIGGIASALGIYKGDGTLPFIMGIESQSTDDTILAATVGIRFYTGSTIGSAATLPTNERMRLYGATGNLVIGGTFTDGGQRLQVYGTGYFSDNVGIGSLGLTNINLRIEKNITGNTVAFNIGAFGTVLSDVTNQVRYVATSINTQAASFTLGNAFHFYAEQGTIGVGSSITNQYGFFANNTIIGATNNYGFYGNIPSGTNRWNLYMAGTANNYMAGNLLIGTTSDQGYRVQITGTGDNMLNVWGATAPSIRIDNAASGATQRFVFGLATATNNFITGAVAGDICMTTQSSNPLLFGANALEVMRITTSRNLLINKTADGGQKLQVSGKVNFASLPTSSAGLAAGDIWNNGGVLNIV